MPAQNNYLTIKENGTHELIIKKSRFIATLIRTDTVEEAEEAIAATAKKYRDATHNTYAYVVGERVKASDNGEPSGTAGIPELKALQLMKLQNVTAIVTRYFGGIKLGTGGLIRAYSNSITKGAQAIGVVKRVQQRKISFHVDYHHFDEISHFLANEQIFIANTNYAADVTLQIYLDEADIQPVEEQLVNILAGEVAFTASDQRYLELPVTEYNYHCQ